MSVTKVLSVEKLRDGGSLIISFLSDDSCEYWLMLPKAGSDGEGENFRNPVLINRVTALEVELSWTSAKVWLHRLEAHIDDGKYELLLKNISEVIYAHTLPAVLADPLRLPKKSALIVKIGKNILEILRTNLRIVAAILFCTSLFLVAFECGSTSHPELGNETVSGIGCLTLGWAMFFAAPAWFVNPIFVVTLFSRAGSPTAIKWLAIAFLLTLTAKFNAINGGGGEIRVLREGYYLWVFSIVILFYHHLTSVKSK